MAGENDAAVSKPRDRNLRHQNRWTHEQRVCIHFLASNNRLHITDRTKIFNHIFKNDLAACGIPHPGLGSNAIYLACHYAKNYLRPFRKQWHKVQHPPDTVAEHTMRGRMRPRTAFVMALNNASESNQALMPPAAPSTPDHLKSGAINPRKRCAAMLLTPPTTSEGHDSESSGLTPPKRLCQVQQSLAHPVVVIPRHVEVPTLTMRWHEKSHPVSGPPTPYWRMGNEPVMLSRNVHSNAPPAGQPYIDVSEKDAHPQEPALLWRYWNDASHGMNSTTGFRSGRSAHARAPPRGPSLCKDLEWTDVLEHLNPNRRLEHPNHSPFISTSSRLVWILRKALRSADPTGRISLLDPTLLDPRAVYYVPPFHTELKKHFAFDNGAAIIKTFTVSTFCEFVSQNLDVKRIMRLDKIRSKGQLNIISRELKRDNIKISNQVAATIAEIAMFFGLDHNSFQQTLSRMIYEIAQGWALTPDGVTPSIWQERVRWFRHTLCYQSEEPISISEQHKIEYAFLDGLRWSRGDVNVRLKGNTARVTMQKRAAKWSEPARSPCD